MDNRNIAHFSDLVKTPVKAISRISAEATHETPTIQVFQFTLVDGAFLLGHQLDRWKRIQLYKRTGSEYHRLMTLDPR
jgi:hypothetical protein